MKSATILLSIFSCIYFCRGLEDYTLGGNLFGVNDIDAKSEKGTVVIPQVNDVATLDGKIKSIEFNAHYKGKFSVLVLRRNAVDKTKFEIVTSHDFKVKKRDVGTVIKKEELDLPIETGDVIGVYAKGKLPFGYKTDRSCTGKSGSYLSKKPLSVDAGRELVFKLARKTQNRCRTYPITVTYQPESCGAAAVDVFFVVDISKSIKDHDLVNERKAMRHFFNNFQISENAARIGVIKYWEYTEMEIPLGTHTTREALLAADILTRGDRLSQKAGTRTDLGMNLMMDEMAKIADPNRSQVCILFTDGKATASTQDMKDMIARLEATDILTVAVGVGSHADVNELASIATGPEMSNVYHVKNFNKLADISQKVVKDVCEEVLPDGFTTPPPGPTTTTLPTPVCEDEPLDVYFVVDISKSINEKELAQEQTAVRFFLNHLNIGADGARVALIKYHHFEEEEFGLNVYTSREQLADVDILTRGSIKGGTRTDLAMNMMMDKFEADTATGRKKVAILLTDGKATADLDEMIARLEGTDIKAIACGIGYGADEAELASVATGPGNANVYLASNFESLMGIIRDIVSQACT